MATDDPTSADSLPPAIDYVPRLFTAADLAEMPSDLPSGPVRFELDNGVLVTMSPPGYDHGRLEAAIAAALWQQGEKLGFGNALGEVGIVLRRNPDRIVGADAAFISSTRLPAAKSPEGYLETIPDLVIEVVSKNDTPAYLKRKTRDYLRAGVSIVWLVSRADLCIIEHRATDAPITFDINATLQLPGVIPGFQLRVADLFRSS
jgi:Uma2 family endonuclease